MKTLSLCLLVGLLLAQPATAQRGGPAPRSPEVHADGRVTFRLSAPNATDVRLAGDFLSAPQLLQKDENGITDGAHTWQVWRRYLNETAPLLFQ
jgi:hypothetical protein